jgi:uncharacterized spore protein YtfJ
MPLVKDLMQGWHDNFTVRRVFGDPVEKNNVTIIPVATVAGGGGGGTAPSEGEGEAESTGSGFGGMARPAGVYVIRADSVEWQPAVDVTILGLAGIALAALITVTVGSAIRRRQR